MKPMTENTRQTCVVLAKAGAVVAFTGFLYWWQHEEEAGYDARREAIYKTVAQSHGWNFKTLNFDQTCVVDEEVDRLLENAQIYNPHD
jgi:hypothetical protein